MGQKTLKKEQKIDLIRIDWFEMENKWRMRRKNDDDEKKMMMNNDDEKRWLV